MAPTQRQQQRAAHRDAAAACKTVPGVWVTAWDGLARGAAYNVVTVVNNAGSPSWRPAGAFRARTRKGRVEVMFTGPAEATQTNVKISEETP